MKNHKVKYLAHISVFNETEICETIKARTFEHLQFKLKKNHYQNSSGEWFTCGRITDFEPVPVTIEIVKVP